MARYRSAVALIAAVLFAWVAGTVGSRAQGLVGDGNAVATGFSGTLAPTRIAPGADPDDTRVIDGDGAVLRVIDLQAPGAPPAGQLVQAAKPFTVTAAQIGQVFGVALDRASPPNLYAAATSLYGLPITGPDIDGDGQRDRLQQGAANAAFMTGLFGPDGGPGTIWRIDGATGAVTPHATVALDGVANPGPALGALAFDPESDSLLVVDRATGMIHRIDTGGVEGGRYDHGTTGRAAAGLPPVPYDPSGRLDIRNPAFRPGDPATWGLPPPARRVFAVALQGRRLFYSVAEGLQIWSVSLATDGRFGNDARLELSVPPGPSPSEIAGITFDDRGRMLLAERVAPSGAYDFVALTLSGAGRVLRFDPATGGGARWQPAAGDPAEGLDPTLHGNGGIAVGSGYDAAGRRDPAVCAGSVWWTGEELALGSPHAVNGLAGRPDGADAIWAIDFDERLDDPAIRGWMGGLLVFRTCTPTVAGPPPAPAPIGEPPPTPGPGQQAAFPWPGMPDLPPGTGPIGPGPDGPFGPWWPDGPWPPPPLCPVGTHLEENGLQCCPLNQIPGPTGACRSPCANGSLTDPDASACLQGFQPTGLPRPNGICWNGTPPVQIAGCPPASELCWKCPKSPLKTCPAGWTEVVASAANPVGQFWWWSDRTCVPTATQLTCPPGQQVGLDGVCAQLCPAGQISWSGVRRCCVNGTGPDAAGQCNPGFVVPPQWFLDYVATGSGPCIPPNCSRFEFTVTGRGGFGRGSLTQRITLPPGSAFAAPRVTSTGRHCPASAVACRKAGDVVTCSVEDCGLAAGDQVAIQFEGRVAPDITAPPPAPIERTACGELEWLAAAGPLSPPGRPGDPDRTQARQRPQETPPATTGPGQPGGATTKRACWTIRLVGRPVQACASGYVPSGDGQCCLAGQMTTAGVCCPPATVPRGGQCVPRVTPIPPEQRLVPDPGGDPARCLPGQRWDARRRACLSICPEGRVWTGRRCECPPGTVERRGRCVGTPEQTCGPNRTGLWPNCCPPGQRWDGRRCLPPDIGACPPDSIGRFPSCRCRPPLVGAPGRCRPPACPPGTTGTPPRCKPIVRECPPGTTGRPPRCRPEPAARPTPERPPIQRPPRPQPEARPGPSRPSRPADGTGPR